MNWFVFVDVENIIESQDFDAIVTDYVRAYTILSSRSSDIDMQLQMGRQLTDEYRDAKASQMDYVMYTLTVFFGFYGMNFDVIPELLGIVITVALQLYFCYKEWI